MAMPLQAPTPEGILELFRDEIVVREVEGVAEYEAALRDLGEVAWDRPFPGVEMLACPDGTNLVRVTYKRLIDGAFDESDRIRHELRQLRNDIRAAIPSDCQVEFTPPGLTHVDRAQGLEVICTTHGIVRGA